MTSAPERVTVAPATAAPEVSLTVPTIAPSVVLAVCAAALIPNARNETERPNVTKQRFKRSIRSSCSELFSGPDQF